MLNKILLSIVTLLIVGCQQPAVPTNDIQYNFDEPEAMANCIEDQMDLIKAPEGLDAYESVDYRENQATLICKRIENENKSI